MTVTFIPPIVNLAPSSIPAGEESQTDVNVVSGHHIKSNCMWNSPFSRGLAVRELNNMSTAIPIATRSDKGIRPQAGRVGIFLMRAQF